MKVDCFKGPSSRDLWWEPLLGGSLSGCGTGRWQNFPVELAGHQHSSRPMQRPPFRQGIWQKSTTTLSDWQLTSSWYQASRDVGDLEGVEPLEIQGPSSKPWSKDEQIAILLEKPPCVSPAHHSNLEHRQGHGSSLSKQLGLRKVM